MCAHRDAMVIIFFTNDLFLSVESFFKINYYINRNSNKYHDNKNNYIIIKYYYITKYYYIILYYDNNIYNNNTNTYNKIKNFIITRPRQQKRITSYVTT